MRLETERLLIREFVPGDARDLYEILGDEETMAYSEPPYTLERTQAFLAEFCIEKRGALAAEEKASGKVIGYILFHPLEEDVYELGWFFNRSCWRRGYAYEACCAVKRYAFTELRARKLVAETIDTERSVPLMEKLGMVREGAERVRAPWGDWVQLYLYGTDGRKIRQESVIS